MAVISLPANFSFTSVKRFALQRASNVTRSKYTGVRQKIIYPFAVWIFEANLVEYDGQNASKLRSFLVQLEGKKNTFRLPVPGYSKPTTNNVNANAAVRIAAAARATTLFAKSLPASVAALNEGDYFTIQDELKMVTISTASDGSGFAQIDFQPPLRKPAAVDVAITLINPTCLMEAQDDDIADWALSPPYRHKVTFDAIEAIDP
jgi:hypothetical protein